MTRFGYVAIMGAPNAGKSTLLNHLLGWPVASVTHKAHTTRQSLLGVYISGKTQIGILDTLGVTFRNREKLCPYLFPHTWNQVSRVHVVLWMVSLADRWDSKHKEFFHQFQKASLPHIQLWVVFNKKDCVKPQVALEFMEHFQQFGEKIHRFYTISCKTEWGIQDLKDDLCSVMPEGSWKYHEKTPWTASRERLAADITQEAILINLHQELPYDIHVQPISFEENELVWKMYQDIIVIKESHKPIVLGAKGQTLKRIGIYARQRIKERFNVKGEVQLFLSVKKKKPHTLLPVVFENPFGDEDLTGYFFSDSEPSLIIHAPNGAQENSHMTSTVDPTSCTVETKISFSSENKQETHLETHDAHASDKNITSESFEESCEIETLSEEDQETIACTEENENSETNLITENSKKRYKTPSFEVEHRSDILSSKTKKRFESRSDESQLESEGAKNFESRPQRDNQSYDRPRSEGGAYRERRSFEGRSGRDFRSGEREYRPRDDYRGPRTEFEKEGAASITDQEPSSEGSAKPFSEGSSFTPRFDRPRRPFTERKEYSDNPRPFRSRNEEGSPSEGGSSEFRPRRSFEGSGDRPFNRPRRPFEERRSYSDHPRPFRREEGDQRSEPTSSEGNASGQPEFRPRRSFEGSGDRPQRSFESRGGGGFGGERRPFRPREGGFGGDRRDGGGFSRERPPRREWTPYPPRRDGDETRSHSETASSEPRNDSSRPWTPRPPREGFRSSRPSFGGGGGGGFRGGRPSFGGERRDSGSKRPFSRGR